ncbi:MAG: PorT family protein [Bacteroidales bacterium]|nr:PorT family protein [Bacteroidales bacterium]MCF8328482.1 PorT family protein [Bacteroidales bacterium]
MPDKKKNIDNLFAEGLEKDKPAFKEEYWTQFEQMMDNQTAPGNSRRGKSGGTTASGMLFKGLIIIAISGIIFTTYILLINHSNSNETRNSQNSSIQNENTVISNESGQNNLNNNDLFVAHEINKADDSYHPVPSKDMTGKPTSLKGDIPVEKMNKKHNKENVLLPVGEILSDPDIKTGNSEDISNLPAARESSRIHTGATDKSNDEHDTKLTIDTVKNPNTTEAAETPIADSLEIAEQQEAEEDQPEIMEDKKESLIFSIVPGVSFYNQISNRSSNPTGTGLAPTFGVSLQYALGQKLSVAADASLLSTKGHQLTYTSTKISYLIHERKEITSIENREFSFIEIPLKLYYHQGNHSFGFGPHFMFLLNAHGSKSHSIVTPFYASFDSESISGYTDGLKRMTSGLGVEYIYNISGRFAAVVRYNYMFVDFTKDSIYPHSNNDNLNTLNLSLKFKISNK